MTSRWATAAAVIGLIVTAACSEGVPGRAPTEPPASSVAPGSPASISPSAPSPGRLASLTSAPCPDPLIEGVTQLTLAGFSCSRLTVPQRRSDPTGPSIELDVAIAKATSTTPKPDPVVYLVGGPGGPGMLVGPGLLQAKWNADRDLIVVNQRGSRYTDPALVCPALDRFGQQAVGLAMTDPAVAEWRLGVVQQCRDRLATLDPDLGAFSTTESAADLADLRVAMGIDAWNLVGSSYGTDLALQAVRSHPEGIRSVVLDSVIPPQVNLVGSRWRSIQLATTAVFEACDAQPACRRAYPRLRQEFAQLLTQLTAEPRRVTVTDPAGTDEIDVTIDSYALLGLLTIAAGEPEGFKPIPAMIHELADGGGQRAAAAIVAASAVPPGLTGYGLFYGVLCSEYVPQASRDELRREARKAFPRAPDALTTLVPSLARPFEECARWDVLPAPAEVSSPLASDLPILMLSGTFDTQTPPDYARQAARTLPKAIHKIIPGGGHVLSTGYPCAQKLIFTFLDRLGPVEDRCLSTATVPRFDVP